MPSIDLPCLILLSSGTTGDPWSNFDSSDALAVVGDGKDAYIKWERWGNTGELNTGNPAFGLATIPEGSTVVDISWVVVGYRTGGGDHPSPDLSNSFSSTTYPTLQVDFTGSGTSGAGVRIEPLPIGGYDGELVVPISPNFWKYFIEGHPDAPPGFLGFSPDLFTGPGDYDFGVGVTYDIILDYFAVRVTYETSDAGRLRVYIEEEDQFKLACPLPAEGEGSEETSAVLFNNYRDEGSGTPLPIIVGSDPWGDSDDSGTYTESRVNRFAIDSANGWEWRADLSLESVLPPDPSYITAIDFEAVILPTNGGASPGSTLRSMFACFDGESNYVGEFTNTGNVFQAGILGTGTVTGTWQSALEDEDPTFIYGALNGGYISVRRYDNFISPYSANYTLQCFGIRINITYGTPPQGRLKVLVPSDTDPDMLEWKFAGPHPGENNGFGRLKVYHDGVWKNA